MNVPVPRPGSRSRWPAAGRASLLALALAACGCHWHYSSGSVSDIAVADGVSATVMIESATAPGTLAAPVEVAR